MAGAFLQGYRDQENADRQGVLSTIQNVSGVLSLKQHLDEQASNEALKGALAASGGDLTRAMQVAVQSGNLAGAGKLAPLLKIQQEADMSKRLAGIDVSNMTPEKATAAGMQFSAAGHPLGPAFMTLANQLRTQEAAAAENRGQVSTPAPITATPQMGINPMGVLAERSQIPTDSAMVSSPLTTEPVPQAVLDAMQSGGKFAIGVGPSTNPAENTQRVGGLFSPLYTSENPAIRSQAAMQQLALDRSNPRVVSPTSRIAAFDRLAAANTASANATAMKQMGIDNRQPHSPTFQTDSAGNLLVWDSQTNSLKPATMSGTGEQVKAKIPANPKSEQLYKDYVNNPEVKAARDLEYKLAPIADYMKNFAKTGKSINANDQALAKAYIAVTTPVGSRAYAMDQKALGALPDLGDRLGNMASSFFAGKDLTDATRKEMFNVLRERYMALDSARQETKAQTIARAKANGIPVEQIFGADD